MNWYLFVVAVVRRCLYVLCAFVVIISVVALILLLMYLIPSAKSISYTPGDFGWKYEDVSFLATDDVTLRGWFIPTSSRLDNVPTLILAHGYGSNKGDLVPLIKAFHDSYNVLLFDFRAHGESGGMFATFGAREQLDVIAAGRYLLSQGHNDIGLWGFSTGGSAVLRAVPDMPYVQAASAEASYAQMDTMLRVALADTNILRPVLSRLIGWWAWLIADVYPPDVNIVESVQTLSRPVLITHSEEDAVIPVSQARIFGDMLASQTNVTVTIRPRGGHGVLNGTYQSELRAFFDAHMRNEEQEVSVID